MYTKVSIKWQNDTCLLIQQRNMDQIPNIQNPFEEQSNDLMVLDTKDIVDKSVEESVRNAERLGKEQYMNFVKSRLIEGTIPISDTIKKNKLPLFNYKPTEPAKQNKMTALKNDVNLFSQLYIGTQSRDGDLDNFFSHENQSSPPSLSNEGSPRSGDKSALLPYLESECTIQSNAPAVDVKVFDGAAIVQMLNQKMCRTFKDYSDEVFAPYMLHQLQTVTRIDLVWDVYLKDSLKAGLREKRGKGFRKRVISSATMPKPKEWGDFLRVDENKTELFKFLSSELIKKPCPEGKIIIATDEASVLSSSQDVTLDTISPCIQEEADTRVILHVKDAIEKGYSRVMIKTVDTDIVVIAISFFSRLQPEEFWVAFGTGNNHRFIAIHEIANSLSPSMCSALPMFHAMTGCDTVSFFYRRGKSKAWETWAAYPDVTEAFQMMTEDVSDEMFSLIERFVVLMYESTSNMYKVNQARKELFTKKSRSLENIPPTQAALKQHVLRAQLQAMIWINACVKAPPLHDPGKFGWVRENNKWKPFWTDLPQAAKSCYELIKCGCKKGCIRNCKCRNTQLKCTALCACGGDC